MLPTLLQECLMRALAAAIIAGEAILEIYQGEIDVVYKEDDTPLTLADERAHSVILNHLQTESPHSIPVLSEEGKHASYDERRKWEYFWLVDPLDGTKEFVKKRGEFSVNIALIERKRPVLGVVLAPVGGLVYLAAEGLGAYKLFYGERTEHLLAVLRTSKETSAPLPGILESGEKLPMEQPPDSRGDGISVVGSRSHGTEAVANFVGALEQQHGKVELKPAGSALKFCLVAQGSADMYPRFGPTMEWDTAAGQCVVEQSGGAVLRMSDRAPLDYNKRDLRNPYFIALGSNSRDFWFPFEGA
ncbi:MAG: 3'(2'),5'-bisphosphate nucleotidase CysQ [Deltaproteobacteria bacterium]|nr:MAG: 3'(2'),5'-bisphosphate nucleotidase CysQ [Deltaproteobacteria bacterium]